MKNVKKRWLPLFLSVVMVLSTLSVPSYAEGTNQTAPPAVEKEQQSGLEQIKTTAAPEETKAAEPESPTKANAEETKAAAPEKTTAAPEETKAAEPESPTKANAEETTAAAPEETTEVPEETMEVPEETMEVPEETTEAPEETTEVPEETTEVPEETTVELPEETTAEIPNETQGGSEMPSDPSYLSAGNGIAIKLSGDALPQTADYALRAMTQKETDALQAGLEAMLTKKTKNLRGVVLTDKNGADTAMNAEGMTVVIGGDALAGYTDPVFVTVDAGKMAFVIVKPVDGTYSFAADSFSKLLIAERIEENVFTDFAMHFVLLEKDRDASNPGGEQTVQCSATLIEGADANGVWNVPSNGRASGHGFTFRVTYSMSGTYDAGKIQIRIPYRLLKDMSDPQQWADVTPPTLPFPRWDAPQGTNPFAYWIDEAANEIVIANIARIPAAEQGYFDVTYWTSEPTYNYYDYNAAGNGHDSANPKNRVGIFKGTIVINKGNDNPNENPKETTEEIPVYINTDAKITSVVKYAPSTLYAGWQSSWGNVADYQIPGNPNNYYYLIWDITSYGNATERYNFSIVDTVTVNNAADPESAVVGYKMRGESIFTPAGTAGAGTAADQTADLRSGRHDFVLTRHSKGYYDPLLEANGKFTIKNSVTAHVTPIGDGGDQASQASAERQWTYVKPEVPHFPGVNGSMGVSKYGLDANDRAVSSSDQIRRYDLDRFKDKYENKIDDLPYVVTMSSNAYQLTAEGSTLDPDNYGKKTLTYVLEDKDLSLAALQDNASFETLVPGDYQFDKLVLSWQMKDPGTFSNNAFHPFVTDNYTYTVGQGDSAQTVNETIIVSARFGNSTTWVDVAVYNLMAEGTDEDPKWTGVRTDLGVSADGTTVLFANEDDNECTGFRVTTTNKHYSTSLSATAYVALLRNDATGRVERIVDESYNYQNEIWLKNSMSGKLYVGNSTTPARSGSATGQVFVVGRVLYSEISKTVSSWNDTANQRVKLTWYIEADEYYVDGETQRKFNVKQNGGTYYDLLPLGGVIDLSTLRVYADGRLLSEGGRDGYSYKVISTNWKNSGRWMIRIKIYKPGYVYKFGYTTNHSWNNVTNFGNDVMNTVAYQTGNAHIADGYPDNGGNLPNSVTNPERSLMSGLDPSSTGDRFIYTYCPHTISAQMAGNLGLFKLIQAVGDDVASNATTTTSNGLYQYNLTFRSSSTTQATNLILFDSLENFDIDVSSDWHGYLVSVYTGALEKRGVKPVVYYSTVENLIIDNENNTGLQEFDRNFSNLVEVNGRYYYPDGFEAYDFAERREGRPIWVKASEYRGDLKDVKAVAIDARYRNPETGEAFVLPAGDAITVTLNMQAPSYLPETAPADAKAYNNIYLYNSVTSDPNLGWASDVIHQNYTQISFRISGDVNIMKVAAEDYPEELTPIPGVEFKLSGTSAYGTDVELTGKTDDEGKLTFSGLEMTAPNSPYYLEELWAPDDYLINREPVEVHINYMGEAVIATAVYNNEVPPVLVSGYSFVYELNDDGYYVIGDDPRPHGDLDIYKLSSVAEPGDNSTYPPVPQAKFSLSGVSDFDTHVNQTLVSDGTGKIEIRNLEQGTYEFIEIEAPAGYTLNPQLYYVRCDSTGAMSMFILDENNHEVPVTEMLGGAYVIHDDPIYSFELYKYNSYNFENVAGAVFSLTGTSNNGTPVNETSTTGPDGILTFPSTESETRGIEAGSYVLKETSAPQGYDLDPTEHTVVIAVDGTVTIDNKTQDQMLLAFLEAKFGDQSQWAPELQAAYEAGVYQYFPIPNDPETKYIEIEKVWVDDSDTDNRTFPVIHISTEKPDTEFRAAVINKRKWHQFAGQASYPTPIPIQNATSFGKNNAVSFDSVEEANAAGWTDITDYNEASYYNVYTYETFNETRRTEGAFVFVRFDATSQKIEWCTNADVVYLPIDSSQFMSVSGAIGSPLVTVDMSGLSSAGVRTMSQMFRSLPVTSITGLASWDTSSVADFSEMFIGCTNLTTLDIPNNFVTAAAVDYYTGIIIDDGGEIEWDKASKGIGSFSNIVMLGYGGVSDWSGAVTGMFRNCSQLTSLNVSGWNISNLRKFDSTFSGMGLTAFDGTAWDMTEVREFDFTFSGCTSLKSVNFNGTNAVNLESLAATFKNCTSLESVDLRTWSTEHVGGATEMFFGCKNVQSAQVSPGFHNFNTATDIASSFLSMSSMFKDLGTQSHKGGKFLNDLGVSSWNMSRVRYLDEFFSGGYAQDIACLDLSDWDVSHASSLANMFYGAKLNTLDCSDWTLPSADSGTINLSGFLGGTNDNSCSECTTLLLTNWNLSGAYDVTNMIRCSTLQTIVCDYNWAIEDQNLAMFKYCPQLQGGIGEGAYAWTASAYDARYARVNGSSGYDGYFTTSADYQNSQPSGSGSSANRGIRVVSDGALTPVLVESGKASVNSPLRANRLTNAVAPSAQHIRRLSSGESGGTEDPDDTEPIELITNSEMIQAGEDPAAVNGVWIDNGDNTWTYRIGVPDVNATYYVWEDPLPGYESDMPRTDPLIITYHKADADHEDFWLTADPASDARLVEEPAGSGNYKIVVTNTVKNDVGLTVRKVVTGVSTTASFPMTVTIYTDAACATVDTSVDGTYGGMNFTAGQATISLRGGMSLSATGLPEGRYYKVVETNSNGYSVTYSPAQTGQLSTTPITITVTNHKPVGSMKIEKTVSGGSGSDLTRDFALTVTLYDANPNSDSTVFNYSGILGGIVFTEGVGTVYLKHGESWTATSDVLVGKWFKVVENAYPTFSTTYSPAGGIGGPITANSTVTVSVTNTKSETGGFKLTKEVVGASGTVSDYSFEVVLENLEKDASYSYKIGTVETPYAAGADRKATLEVTLQDGQTAVFDNLPIGAKYTVTEAAGTYVPSFTVVDAEDGGNVANPSGSNTAPGETLSTGQEVVDEGEDVTITFTNTFIPPISVTVTKEWLQPATAATPAVTLYLKGDGEEVAHTTLNEETGWTWTVTDLPRYNNGEEITYTIEETAIEGYTYNIIDHGLVESTQVWSFTVENSPETSISGQKQWNDNNDEYGIRPGAIMVSLYKEGSDEAIARQLVTGANGWRFGFFYLPMYELVQGEYVLIEYYVEEEQEPGYQIPVIREDAPGIFTIINTPEVVDVKVIKSWEDNGSVLRPESIVVQLYRQLGASGTPETVGDEVTLSNTSNPAWQYVWEDLAKYGMLESVLTEYIYSVQELDVENYEVVIGGATWNETDKVYEITVTNSLNTGNLQISKTIASGNTDTAFSVEITLTLNNDPLSGTYSATVTNYGATPVPDSVTFDSEGKATVTVRNNTVWTITGLPAGTNYSVTETGLGSGWTPTYSGQSGTIAAGQTATTSITNNYTPGSTSVTIPVRKTLTGTPPAAETFTFVLKEGANQLQTVTVQGSGTASFDPISYTGAGTHTYTVTETEGGTPGMSYDSTVYTLVVTVSDNAGQLTASCTLDDEAFDPDADKIEFANRFTPVNTTIPVTKTVGGTPPETETFTFTLTGVSAYKPDGETVITPIPMPTRNTITISGSGNKSFSRISYNQPGTYTYTVTETPGTTPGMTYDSRTFTVTVTVGVDDTDNSLTVSKSYKVGQESQTTINFTNSFTPVTTTIPVIKSVVGAPPSDEEYTFVLDDVSAVKPDGETEITPVPMPASGGETVTITGSGSGSFGTISYNQPGTYTYTVTETPGTTPGMTYDSRTYTVTVVVGTDANNALTVSQTYAVGNQSKDDITFVNRFDPTGLTIPVRKTLTGTPPTTETFTFTLTEGANLLQTITIQGSGTGTFDPISYSAAGTHTYIITETAGGTPGMSYDSTSHTLVVTVSNNAGRLTVSCTLDGEAFDPEADEVEFANEFKPVTTTIPVTKTVTGTSPETETFTFTLTGVSAFKPDGTTQITPIPMPSSSTITITGSGNKSFGRISYNQPGTYTYTVTETPGDTAGMTYDTRTFTVTVVVSTNASNALTVSKSYKVGEESQTAINFTNTFTPVTTTIPVTKSIVGTSPSNEAYTFVLHGVSAVQPDDETGITPVPMPASGGETVTITGSGSGSFGEISYNQPGTYTYTVTETPGSTPGMIYDDRTYTVTVVVGTDANNALTVSKSYKVGEESKNDIIFVNEFNPTSVTIPVTKTLSGTPPTDEIFTFVLKQNGTVIDTKTVKNRGSVNFNALSYSGTGTYIYTVEEIGGTTPGMTYDSEVYTVTVVVSQDEATHELSASYTVKKKNGVAASKLSFANKFTPVSTTFPVEKKLEGQPPADEDFTFTLTGVSAFKPDGVTPIKTIPMPRIKTLTITGAGRDSFGSISYNQPGTYTYTVTEDAGKTPGMTYDSTVYTVTVVVGISASNALTISQSYKTDSGSAASIVFTNKITPVTTTIPVKKTVVGNPPETEKYTFTLKAVSATEPDGETRIEPIPIPSESEIKITGSGTGEFGKISYDRPGTYVYEVAESAGSTPGMSYDTRVFTVTVTVGVDKTDNSLTVSQAYKVKDEEQREIEFVNKFTPAGVTIPVTKVLNGKPPVTETFTFTLEAVSAFKPDGETRINPIPMPASGGEKVTITGSGEGSFGGIAYDQPGTYTYKVTETAGDTAGMTYDSTVYTVIISVDRMMKVTKSYKVGEESRTGISFTNTFTPITTTIPVTKTLEGTPPETEKFTFTLTAVSAYKPDGTTIITPIPVPRSRTLTITGAGSGSFGSISYNQPGTYTYTVKETAGSTPGMTYDSTVYTVTVVVGTDANNALTLTKSYKTDSGSAASIVFTNKFTPVTTTIPVKKTVDGTPPKTENYAFTLKEISATEPDGETRIEPIPMPSENEIKITGSATGEFGKISYDRPGTYVYTVTETPGTTPGMTYDTRVFTVTVTVGVDKTNNSLTVSQAYKVKDEEQREIEFVNKFTPVSIEIPVRKVLKGTPPATETFTFVLKQGTTVVSTKTVQGSGSVKFDALVYDAVGTYTYTVSETAGRTPGMTYDSEVYTVTVTVSEDPKTHALKAKYIAVKESDGQEGDIAFTNTFTPITTTIPVVKTLKGTPPETEKFTFTLTAVSAYKPDGTTTITPIPVPRSRSITITGSGKGEFGSISYNQPGTYTYTVTEKAGGTPGMTYDATVYTVTVVVGTDANNALTLSKSYTVGDEKMLSISFTNVFKPITAIIPVKKTVEGNPPKEETYTFSLKAESAVQPDGRTPIKPIPMPGTDTVTIKGSGKADFDAITYNQPGTYTYSVREQAGKTPGMSYDTRTFTVTVTVGVDDTDNSLTVSVAYKVKDDEQREIEFVNTFTPGSITIPVNKVLTGTPPTDETFTFVLKQGTTVISTKTVQGSGSVNFDTMTYDTVGTYSYTVEEIAGTMPGMTYDKEVYTVTVRVTSDPKTNELRVAYTAKRSDGGAASSIEFANTFTSVTAKFPVKKTLTGTPPASERFTFTLTAVSAVKPDGETQITPIPMPSSSGRKVNINLSAPGSKNGTFGQISYNQPGTYTYTVKETAGTTPGMAYDDTVYTVTVTVGTDANNALTISTAYAAGGQSATEMVFTNPFTPATYQPQVEKTLTGEPTVEDKTFSFTLTAAASNPAGASLKPGDEPFGTSITVPAGQHADPITALFGTISFDRPGSYVFTAAEVIPADPDKLPGITYDETVWTLTVTIGTGTDNQLTVSALYTATDKPDSTTQAAFVNNYEVSEIDYTPEVEKDLKVDFGPTLEDKIFDFELVLKEAKNVYGTDVSDGCSINGTTATASIEVKAGEVVGSTSFDPVVFTKAGTYVFEMTEVAKDDQGMIYDTTVWTITVEVVDHDSVLQVDDVVYNNGTEDADKVVFENEYKPDPAVWHPKVQKLLTNDSHLPRKNADFTFELKKTSEAPEGGCELNETLKVTVTLPAGKKASEVKAFNEISFVMAGTYVFTVQELDGNLSGFTYDTKPRTVTVKVIDIGGSLQVDTVTINGGEADIDGTEITVKVANRWREIPQTGDVSNLALWMTSLITSSMMLGGTVLLKKKKEKEEEAE